MNNASAAPSHYADVKLVIHSCTFVNLQKLRPRQRIDLIFQLILIKLLIILMHQHHLYVFIMQRMEKSVINLFSLRVCLSVCVSVCVCECVFVLICCCSYPPVRCSNHQRANLESCSASYTSVCCTSSHTLVETQQFDYTSPGFFIISQHMKESSSQHMTAGKSN